MSGTAPKLVGRHLRVAFLNTDATGSSPKFERMTNFTSMTNGKIQKSTHVNMWTKAPKDQM